MVTKTVKVVEIETVKGNKADRIVLHYVGADGSTWKIGALAAKLDENSRKFLLATKPGDTITITNEKEGNYWNLTSASTATQSDNSSTSYTPQGTSSKGKETDTRIQVMNALTNAIVSLGAGKTTQEYRDRVVEFVLLGNTVVSEALADNLTATTTSDDLTQKLGF